MSIRGESQGVKIHSTAVVGEGVRFGANVEVGAYAIVDDGVVLGDDCVVQAHAVLTNRVTMGDRNFVGYGAVIGSAPQDTAHTDSIASWVVIGDDNRFREHVTIHRGTSEGSVTRVGDGNFLMAGAHLGHNVVIGSRNVIANNCLLGGHVVLGDDAVLGGASAFHQNIRVGDLTMIHGATAWTKDVPPFTMGMTINTVRGLNAVGMRRKGIGAEDRADVKRAYLLIYRSGLNITQAVEESKRMEWGPVARRFLDFVGTKSKRGLSGTNIRARKVAGDPAEDGESAG